MTKFYHDFKLGVLGGGQLGRMLIQSCVNYNVQTCVMDPDSHAPCSGFSTEFRKGAIRDYESVYEFGKHVDLVTIEIENVNVEALEQLEKEGTPVFPQPRVIRLIQDKRTQKQFYKDKGIPTADFILTEDRADAGKHPEFLPAFHKLGKGGYDGGGVQKISTEADFDKAFDAPGLLEKLVNFDKEIAVIASRNSNGEVATFPAVEMVFHEEYNLVDYLISPSSISPEKEKEAQALAKKVIEELDMVGVLAVEMFLTKEGELLVNEVAPRPHNSGHQTINANYSSQYEQHLRAILNLPLGSTAIKKPSAMVNLIGEEGYTGPAIYDGIEEILKIEGVNVFLYGKLMTKPHRKMGHITIIDNDVEALKKKVEVVKKTIKVIA